MTGFLKANYHMHTYRCQHAYTKSKLLWTILIPVDKESILKK